MPSDPTTAHRAAKESAAVFDLTGWTVLTLSGRDAVKFLNNFCTADIKKLSPGESCEAFFTNVKARVVGHGLVLADEGPALTVVTVPGQGEKLAAHLDRYLITEQVTIRDATAETAVLCLAGPDVSDRTRAAGVETATSPRFGPGRGLLVPSEDRSPVLDRLSTAGFAIGGPETFDALRIEAGYPLYGVDVTEDHLAPEVGRPWAISYTKGCYLGQEPIARIDALGHVNRLLCGLKLDAGPVPEHGAPLTADGKEIGAVTSAAMSPADGRPVALAYLRAKFTESGAHVLVRTERSEVEATVYRPMAP